MIPDTSGAPPIISETVHAVSRDGYIRLWACTDDSALGRIALEYCRSLMFAAPVRVISTSGSFQGEWALYSDLATTPMFGPMVSNVVCCDPARWIWKQRVAMPSMDFAFDVSDTSRMKPSDADLPIEWATFKLWTWGTRNVLVAASSPRSKDQLKTAAEYSAIIVPDDAAVAWWDKYGADCVPRTKIPVPVTNHDVLRAAVRVDID